MNMEVKNTNLKRSGRDTRSTAALGGGLTGPRSSSAYDCHEFEAGNPASTLEKTTGRPLQVGNLACSGSYATGNLAGDDGSDIEEWQKATRAIKKLGLSGAITITSTQGQKRRRKTTLSDEEEDQMAGSSKFEELSKTSVRLLEPGRLAEKARNLISAAEEERRRSKNIKGEVSGRMKGSLMGALSLVTEMEGRLTQEDKTYSESQAIQSLRRELKELEARHEEALEKIKTLERSQRAKKYTLPPSTDNNNISDKVLAEVRALAKKVAELQRSKKEVSAPATTESAAPAPMRFSFGSKTGGASGFGAGVAPRPMFSTPQTSGVSCPTGGTKSGIAPEPPSKKDESFAVVLGKKKRRAMAKLAKPAPCQGNVPSVRKVPPEGRKNMKGVKSTPDKSKKKRDKGVERSAAISLTCLGELSYRDAVLRATERINLKELGVTDMRYRRGLTGSLIWQVRGANADKKADSVAEALKGILPEAKVARPQRMIDVRLVGLDVAATSTSIRCSLMETRSGIDPNSIKVGEIRTGRGRAGEVTVSVPAAMAHAALKKGKIVVRLSTVRVKELKQRPLKCDRCWARGHVVACCPSTTDRVSLCFTCGKPGHKAKDCTEKKPCCPVCLSAGRPQTNHRAGS